MEWRLSTKAILARIAVWSSAVDALLAHLQWAGANAEDAIGLLTDQGTELYGQVSNLWRHDGTPRPLRDRLDPILKEKGFRLTMRPGGVPGLLGLYVALATVRGPMEEELIRSEAPRRALVERAFLHLSRTLCVDADIQRRW